MQGFTTHSALETLRLRLHVTNTAIRCKTLHNPTLVVCYFYISFHKNRQTTKKSEKIAITHTAIVIHLQTTDHIEAMDNVAKHAISQNVSKCKSIQVKNDLLNAAKIAIIYIALGLRQQ